MGEKRTRQTHDHLHVKHHWTFTRTAEEKHELIFYTEGERLLCHCTTLHACVLTSATEASPVLKLTFVKGLLAVYALRFHEQEMVASGYGYCISYNHSSRKLNCNHV